MSVIRTCIAFFLILTGLVSNAMAQQVSASSTAICPVPSRNMEIVQYNNRGLKEGVIQIYQTATGWYSSVSEDWPAEVFRKNTLGIPCERKEFKIGDEWGGRIIFTNLQGIKGEAYGKMKVEGFEKVTVPAGTFNAVKIAGRLDFMFKNGASGGVATYVFYYVEELGMYAKMNYIHPQSIYSYSRELQ